SNMQRQAVPLLITDPPLVGTGLEYRAAVDTGDVVIAKRGGAVVDVDAEKIVVEGREGDRDSYDLIKFMRSNQGTLIHQRPVVKLGDKVKADDVLADGSSTHQGELALGKNMLVAFMPWEGYNFEDAIVISERLVKEDMLSSIHIHEYEIDARSTKLGDEEITRDIPNRSEEAQDRRGRQARGPPRQQGRDLEDRAGRGHALPRGRHAGRRRAQSARRPEPDEHRPDPRDAPRLGRLPRRVRRGRLQGRRADAGGHRRLRRGDARGRRRRPDRMDEAERGLADQDERRRESPAGAALLRQGAD